MSQAINQSVEETIQAMKDIFERKPTLFYTENDLVCWFAADLNRRLGENQEAIGRGNIPHRIVHLEYPTPFRCDMRKGGFSIKEAHERTEKRGGFRRGHIDIVVLSPAFIKRHT